MIWNPDHCWLCNGDGKCQPHNDYCQDHESGNPICGPEDPCHVCNGTGRYTDLGNGSNW